MGFDRIKNPIVPLSFFWRVAEYSHNAVTVTGTPRSSPVPDSVVARSTSLQLHTARANQAKSIPTNHSCGSGTLRPPVRRGPVVSRWTARARSRGSAHRAFPLFLGGARRLPLATKPNQPLHPSGTGLPSCRCHATTCTRVFS